MSDLDLEQKFPDMRPLKAMPWLWTVNGCGFSIYGARDHDEETNTYVKTHCLSFVFVPILALGAYRVATAPRGWYFLGRVPLSTLARTWNALVVLAVLAAGGYIAWDKYTHSPEYLSGRKLAQAEQLAQAGQLGQAAQLYRAVAEGGQGRADEALSRLRDLVNGPAVEAPPAEAAAAFQVAVALKDRLGSSEALFQRGMQRVHQLAEADPKGAWLLAEAVGPLAPKAETFQDELQPLLERIVKAETNDPEPASRLAVLYEARRQLPKCEALLLPHLSRLGTREGARILGQILAHQGKFEQAYGLLQPYAEGRLKQLHTAEKAYEEAIKAAQERVLSRLKEGNAPGFAYGRHNAADRAEKIKMVQEYMAAQLKDDPTLKTAQEAIARASDVVPVALDLGIVLLRRGQNLTDPAQRRAELEKAEKTFLAVRGFVGQSDEYRMFLGQVYYWLGKHADGRKLFDELLASRKRDFRMLMGVSHLLREVGADSEARRLAEEAYNQTADESKKHQAAEQRALLLVDLDDKITWLRRADPTDAHVQADLSTALGYKALESGKDPEAANHFREAIAIYARQPQEAATLNNSALAYFSLFYVTGDRTDLDKAMERLDRAVALQPSDSILIGNAAESTLHAALRDIIGDALDLKTLKARGDLELLPYLYRDRAGKERYAERVRSHPGVAKAAAYLDRLMVLAPKRARAYNTLFTIHGYTGDMDALRNLDRRLGEVELDQSNSSQRTLEYYTGKKDKKYQQELTASLDRETKVLSAARKIGGATLAVAAARLVTTKMRMTTLGMPVDAHEVVKLAEEAHAAAPSAATESSLVEALLFRASQTLARQDPAYATMASRARRSLWPTYLIALALSQGGKAGELARTNPDVRRVLEMLQASLGEAGAGMGARVKFPEDATEWLWAMVRTVQPETAARLAKVVAGDERGKLERTIEARLSPLSASAAFKVYWAAQIAGKEAESRAALRRCDARGVPLPFEPK